MKIAFFSNFLNHHQLPLCKEFLENKDVEFLFVATEKIHEERANMGYDDMNSYPFVLRTYENDDTEKQALIIAQTFDIVIFGACPLKYIEKRMEKNKLTFRFCERSLKKGVWRRFIPRTRKKIQKAYIQFKDKNYYILCASAFAASDLNLCGFPQEKCFNWGYFPEAQNVEIEKLIEKKNNSEKIEILYAGRLIKLKRVIDSVKAVFNLVKAGFSNVHFTIIGDGEEKTRLNSYVIKHNLQNHIAFLPFMKPEQVREYMNSANIYIFSSNFLEGWGAVVNEAMNSACTVIISHAVGSTACLIEHGRNGLVYSCGNVSDLTLKLKSLVKNKDVCASLGQNAYKTILEEWNANVAVKRFIELCKSIENGEGSCLFDKGPCSNSKIIKNNWLSKR